MSTTKMMKAMMGRAVDETSNANGSASLPTAALVYVTPTMAQQWLTYNSVNRNLRQNKVDLYARDMASGNWKITGEAIIFDTNGNMANGQHRCHAIVKSGRTVPIMIVSGVAPEAQQAMDSGSTRTASDALAFKGYRNTAVLASVTRRVLIQETGCEPSHAEIAEWIEVWPEIENAASIAGRFAKKSGVAASLVGLSSWMIARSNGWDEAEKFWHTAAELIGLQKGDPILMMRKMFDDARVNSRKRVPFEAQLSIIIRVYNYRRQGRSIAAFLRIDSAKGGLVPVPEVVR